ncbi:unnamed protein product, partial [Brassica rapa]
IASECARSGSDLKFETFRQLRRVAAVSALLPRRLAQLVSAIGLFLKLLLSVSE